MEDSCDDRRPGYIEGVLTAASYHGVVGEFEKAMHDGGWCGERGSGGVGGYIAHAVKERSWVAYLCVLPHIRRYIGYWLVSGRDEACFI